MNIETYNLNDKVLYRKNFKYRFELYTVNNILNDNILELINNYDNIVHINLKTKYKNIQNYIQYDEIKEIYCDIFDKKDLIFSFKCDYCNIIHKHNKLGHQDCKCNCSYSPYYKNGYILKLKEFDLDIVNFNYYENYNIIYNYYKNNFILNIKSMEFSNFNDYLLHNYKLLLVKNLLSKSSIIWYVRYIKQFYSEEICQQYSKKFPFLNKDDIIAIKSYSTENKKISNLVTTLKKFIKLISSETLLFKLDKYEDDMNKLIKFYKSTDKKTKKTLPKKSNKTSTEKKKLFTNKIITNINDNIIQKIPEEKNTSNIDSIDDNIIEEKVEDFNEDNSIEEKVEDFNEDNSIEEKVEDFNEDNKNKTNKKKKYKKENKDKKNEKDNNNMEKKKEIDIKYILDIKYTLDIEDCIKEYINNDIEKQILSKIKITDKHCFYIKLENRIYSQMWGYMDLWITIEDYGDNLWGVSDTNESNPDFIKYKQSIM